ncbi:MAG: hypothetical protein AVDCRST_MAG39-2239, partial [uncultured Sphingomonadaceae bacterium]
ERKQRHQRADLLGAAEDAGRHVGDEVRHARPESAHDNGRGTPRQLVDRDLGGEQPAGPVKRSRGAHRASPRLVGGAL